MKFVAFEREKQGTGASRRLRNVGKVPGIVYGGGEPSMIELDHNALFHALKKEAFHSSILEMEMAGKVQKVLLRDVQMHAWKQQVLHIDFQRVDAKTRVVKKVPLHFVNEENAPAVKLDKCLINHVVNELEIECLAEKLPEFLTVDLGNLAKGQSMHVNDLKLDAGIKVVLRGRKNPTLAAVVAPKEEEAAAEAAAAPVVAAAPAPTKHKKDEKQNKR
jgi:large subunit ribosomal protein L25